MINIRTHNSLSLTIYNSIKTALLLELTILPKFLIITLINLNSFLIINRKCKILNSVDLNKITQYFKHCLHQLFRIKAFTRLSNQNSNNYWNIKAKFTSILTSLLRKSSYTYISFDKNVLCCRNRSTDKKMKFISEIL